MIHNKLTETLGVPHPIVLAPMDGVAGGRLAAAVSNAGAYGQVGGGYCDIPALKAELDLAAGERVGVGFITFALEQNPDALHVALDHGVPSVQLSFGDPRPWVDEIHDAGALLFCGVQTPDEVDLALEAGADVLIAQGRDAGGHGRPDIGTMALIPSVVDRAGSTPVVAAGGIVDGRGLAAALMLGAQGVTMGSRFLASSEAITNPVESAMVLKLGSADTVRTDVYDVVRGPAWPSGHDGRVYRSEFVKQWESDAAHPDSQVSALRRQYSQSQDRDYSVRPLWVGEGVGLIDSIEPAADIVEKVISDAEHALVSAANLVGD